MPLKEAVLGQFLGDEKFPVSWTSETEKLLFWVYDDLHCPHPLSPMYEDIGGWWLSCDHMFRRFGTPFATDWIYKNINGYLYTAAIPAEAGLQVATQEYNYATSPVVPEAPDYAAKIGTYLGAVLPTYGLQFANWWRDRLVPEMDRNFAYLEGMLDKQGELNLMELACLLEDAIDIHDRHWKIHWMLNFAQLSATLNLRAVMEKSHGKINEQLLGRLQNSARDRNWDSIEALWKMKEEAKADPDLAAIFRADTAGEIIAALKASERGRRFIDERVVPYQKEYGWHAVWSHEFIFPNVVEVMEPVVELVRGYIENNYDYPKTIGALAADIAAAAKEILDGLEGEALEEMRAANEINLRMAPLTPDHHFYIDQGANAHVRQVLLAIGRKLVAAGALEAADDVILFRYNELRVFMGNLAGMDGRAIVAKAKAAREKAYTFRPKEWVGTVTPPSWLPTPEPGASPTSSTGRNRSWPVGSMGSAPRPACGGHRPRGPPRGPVRRRPGRRHPRLPDDEPGLGRPLHQDRRPRDGCGWNGVASGRPLSRVRHPGRRRDVRGDRADQEWRPRPHQRHER